MFLDFFFPRGCLGCGRWGRYFCKTCLATLQLLEVQICPQCGQPAISGRTHRKCQTKYALDGLVSFFAYQKPIKTAIARLKYKLVTDLAEELVALIDQHIKLREQDFILSHFKSFTLVPVPLHPRRQRQRGFNQAEILGKLLAKNLNWRFEPGLLIRTRHTKPQVKLKGEERKRNVKDVFSIAFKLADESTGQLGYLIFDDVWTTGSTLRECALVLKKAGAKKVWGLTLAR